MTTVCNKHLAHLYVLPLLFLTLYVSAQKKIAGPILVNPNSTTAYSIQINAEKIEWQMYPDTYGHLIHGIDQQRVSVQWNHNALALKVKPTCTLVAQVSYPNSERPTNFIKTIQIRTHEDSMVYRKTIKPRFSQTSRDSLRYFFKVNCNGGIHERSLSVCDSSRGSLKNVAANWLLMKKSTHEQSSYTGHTFSVELSPGHYTLRLTKYPHTHQAYEVSDTFSIYPGLQPSFTVSNPLPCAESAISFSNTSKDQSLALNSTFYFGTGSSQQVFMPQNEVQYSYSKDGMSLVLITYMETQDFYACTFKSAGQPIAVQDNKFTPTNMGIEPRNIDLKNEGDSAVIKVIQGSGFSPANPHAPFTYVWNTGQSGAELIVKERGRYSVTVKDKYGCVAQSNYVNVTKSYKEMYLPKIKGPVKIKAGAKMEFSLETCKDCLYQWKFIMDKGAPITTEPSPNSKIIPEGWQKSKPGTLKVIGIVLKQKGLISHYSDTLRVRIY